MRYLLDTHALVWWLFSPALLSGTAHEAIGDPQNEILVSAISAYEVANKNRIGKWEEVAALAGAFEELVAAEAFTMVAVSGRHASVAGLLRGEPRDPFDRLIAAQAIVEGVPVLTVDPAFQALGAEVAW